MIKINVALARDTLKVMNTAIRGHILTDDDLTQITMIIMARAEEIENKENDK